MSVTNHHPHAHPPTTVRLSKDPQQPPTKTSLKYLYLHYFKNKIMFYIHLIYISVLLHTYIRKSIHEFIKILRIMNITYQKQSTLHLDPQCIYYPFSVFKKILKGTYVRLIWCYVYHLYCINLTSLKKISWKCRNAQKL